jgi:hypothetical protein
MSMPQPLEVKPNDARASSTTKKEWMRKPTGKAPAHFLRFEMF